MGKRETRPWLYSPNTSRGNLVRSCSVEGVLPETLVEKQSSGNWTLSLFLKESIYKQVCCTALV